MKPDRNRNLLKAMQSALAFSESLYSHLHTGFVAFDLEMNIIYWGRYLETVTGVSRDQALGQSVEAVLPFLKIPPDAANLQKSVQGVSSASTNEWRNSKGQPQKYFHLTFRPLRSEADESGEILGGVISFVDETETKLASHRLHETELRFQNMADHSPVLLWMSGTDGLCNFFNQTWLNFTGRTLEQEWGVGWAEAVHHEDFQRSMDTYMSSFNARKPFEMEYRLLRHDGQYRWILDRGAPRYLPGQIFAGFIGSCIDITDRKIAEYELLKAKRRAEAANEAKGNFLAVVSHEIRTPLGIVLGFSDLLASESTTPSDKLNLVNSIRRNGILLSNIVNSILDLSKIEAGKYEVDKVPVLLSGVLDEICMMMELYATEKGLCFDLRLAPALPKKILTDPLRVKQILLNVIGNAIKFTTQGSVTIEVNLIKGSDDSARLQIEVADTGEGIHPETSDKIFEAFTQADSSMTRKHGGTGLGLTLARQLAASLGGNVVLKKTALGVGSVFAIDLSVSVLPDDCEIPQPKGAAPPLLERSTSQLLMGRHVLVVDDSKDNQALVSLFLKTVGATVDFADNGALGVEKALAGQYDAILMDIQMPVKDGYEALADLQKVHYHKPVIALTAFAMTQDRENLLSRGFNEYLSKPIDRAGLIKTIARVLQLEPH